MAFESINLNLIPTGDAPVIHAAQYDIDRPLIINMYLGEDAFTPTDLDIELQVRKVDNNIVTAVPDSVDGNVITFLTTEQMTACSGSNLCSLKFTAGENHIATLHFFLVVQRDVLQGGLTSQSEIHDLAEQIAEIVPSVIGDEYYTAEQVDEKIAEIPTFDPTNYYTKSQLYTKTETNGLLSAKANTSALSTVAFSGSYTDLSNKPVIPDVSNYYTKSETYNQTEVNNLLSTKADTSSLSAVATSGNYNDLSNKPTIPAAQVNSDWDAVSGVAQILNKPSLSTVATSGDYGDLLNKPTIPAAQVQSDWSQSDNTQVDYIKNKPTVYAYGDEMPMSSTDSDKVADRIEALETIDHIGTDEASILGRAMQVNDTFQIPSKILNHKIVTITARRAGKVNSVTLTINDLLQSGNTLLIWEESSNYWHFQCSNTGVFKLFAKSSGADEPYVFMDAYF